MTEIIDVRQSQLNSFDNCGEAHRRRYLENEIIPPGIAALRGSGFHAAAETNHKQKRKSGKDLPAKELVDLAITSFDELRARDGFRLTAEEMKIGKRPMIARTKNTIQALTNLYSDRVAPSIEPDLVEAKITVKVAETVTLTEAEIKTLVVEDKWLDTLATAIQGEMDRISQTLTRRVKELAERYETPLPLAVSKVADLERKVNRHLERMGFSWN